MNYLYKFILVLIFSIILLEYPAMSENKNEDFNEWLVSYKEMAFKKGISKETLEKTFKNVKYLEKVIKYDRKQPEFFEDTLTYVSKRATKNRAEKAKTLFTHLVEM